MIRFMFINDHRTEYSVKRMCAVLKVQRPSYYKWVSSETKRDQRKRGDERLKKRIETAFDEEHGLYGAKRLAAKLTAQTSDQPVNHKRVARLMRARGLYGFTKGAV